MLNFDPAILVGKLSDKQKTYIRDLIVAASEELESLSARAPRSCEHVAGNWNENLSTKNTHFADTLISTLREHDWLMEVYRVAERTLRVKEEKESLKPLVEKKFKGFRR